MTILSPNQTNRELFIPANAGVDETVQKDNVQAKVNLLEPDQTQNQPQMDERGPAQSSRAIESLLTRAVAKKGVVLQADELKKIIKKQYGDATKAAKKELSRLEPLRQAAAKSLDKLNAFTGHELAAFSTAAGKKALAAAQKAIEAQLTLADALSDAANRTGSAELMTLSTSANLRACEITRLLGEMNAYAAQQENSGSNWNLAETGHVDKLAEISVRSHGTLESIKNSDDFKALFAELAQLEASSTAEGTAEECLKVEGLLAKCQSAVGELKKTGTDQATLDALSDVLGQAKKRFGKYDRSLKRRAVVQYVENWKLPADLSEQTLRTKFPHSNVHKNVQTLVKTFEDCKDAVRNLLLPTGKDSKGDLRQIVHARLQTFQKEVDRLQKAYGRDKDIKKHLQLGRLAPLVNHDFHVMQAMIDRNKKSGAFKFEQGDILAVLEDRCRFSDTVTALAWNYGPDQTHPRLKGAELVDVKELGTGTFNSVKLCTFKGMDGQSFQLVFKGEGGAWMSEIHGAVKKVGTFNDQDAQQCGIDTNLATAEVADLMACGDLLPKNYFGTLNGEAGFFQELAPGCTAIEMLKNDEQSPDDRSYSLSEFKSLRRTEPEKYKAMVGQLRRKLNRLHWLDILCGQVDRSRKNYMAHLGRDGTVSVKAIDNDESFPTGMIGIGRIEMSQDIRDIFLKKNITVSPQACVTVDGKECLDIYKLPPDQFAAFSKECGFRNLQVPKYMDREFYDQLCHYTANEENLAQYVDRLKKCHLTEEQIAAAVKRLKAAKAFGDELLNQGRVLLENDNEWNFGEDDDSGAIKPIQNTVPWFSREMIDDFVFYDD